MKNVATEKDLHLIRFSKSAEKIFEKTSQMTNLAEAVKLLGSLLNKVVVEQCGVTRYDSKSGKPLEFEWLPFEEWDGRIWIDCMSNSPSFNSSCPFLDTILKRVPPDKTLIVGQVSVTHVPEYIEHGGTTPAHLVFHLSV